MNESVLVVGSANMDLVARVRRFPNPGETILCNDFAMYPGGKGANQAVCCAKLGARVDFIAKTGDDIFRERLIQSLSRHGVRTALISSDGSASTGVALILVEDGGQNEITVVSGTNMLLLPADLEGHPRPFKEARVALLQLEIPLETVMKALQLAKMGGAITILNPAPARDLPLALLRFIDVLTPNETECEMLSGIRVVDEDSAEEAAVNLLRKGVKNVVVTMGDKGALRVNASGSRFFDALRVEAVDTTAAGDAFNGALAVSLGAGKTLDEAIGFANSVAAFSVTRKGAQTSMPTMDEFNEFLKSQED